MLLAGERLTAPPVPKGGMHKSLKGEETHCIYCPLVLFARIQMPLDAFLRKSIFYKINSLFCSCAVHMYACVWSVITSSERPEGFPVLCKHASPDGPGCQSLQKNNAGVSPGITPSGIKFSLFSLSPSLSGYAQLCPSGNAAEPLP